MLCTFKTVNTQSSLRSLLTSIVKELLTCTDLVIAIQHESGERYQKPGDNARVGWGTPVGDIIYILSFDILMDGKSKVFRISGQPWLTS